MTSRIFANVPGNEGIQGKSNQGAVLNGSLTKNERENTFAKDIEHRPYFHTYDEPFSLHDKLLQPGLYYHDFRGKNKQESNDIWVCSPIHVIAETCDENYKNWGLLLRFRDRSDRWEDWAMPLRLISGQGEELRALLLSMGVWISEEGDSLLIKWLRRARLKKRIYAASHTGWYRQDDKWAFVLPRQVIGSDNVCFQSEYGASHDYKSSGTLQAWQSHVAAYGKGNPMLLFVLSAAFAGPLLRLINHSEGGLGIHLQGDSSKGKTTALHMAASVWGASSFVKTWQATTNGLEGIAASLNDTLLVLDEISQCDPHQIGAVVYALGNGVGKQRANRYGLAKTPARWRILWISSGERSLEAHMREANLMAKAGQQVRLLNIPVTDQCYGVFDNLHAHTDGSAFADAVNKACKQYYGHAGIAFIKRLIADKQDFEALYTHTLSLPLFTAKEGIGSRAAKVFALVAMAGELAIEYGIVPWDSGSALEAASAAYQKWHSLHGGGQTEEQQILKAIQTFINKHGDSHFLPLRSEHRLPQAIYNRAGFWKDNKDGRVYCFYPTALEEIAGGFDKARIALTLEHAGWLIERDKDKRTKKMLLPDGSNRGLYVVQPKEQDEDA